MNELLLLRGEQDLVTIRRGVRKQGGIERVEHRDRSQREGSCSVRCIVKGETLNSEIAA